MITNQTHPQSGFSYIHVVPRAAALEEIEERYLNFGPWLTAVTADRFEQMKRSDEYQDPRNFFVVWGEYEAGPKNKRRAMVGNVYSEAIGRRDQMLTEHQAVLDRFLRIAGDYDCMFAHTPWMTDQLATRTGLPAYLFPVGYDAKVLGSPDFDASKEYSFIYYGSDAGKRTWARPIIQAALGSRFEDTTSWWRKDLIGRLNKARASLYFAHSDVASFSTWRMWHAVASSAALVAEFADCWPMIPWTHFVPLPRLTRDSTKDFVDELIWILESVDLLSIAKRAHQDLADKYSTRLCIDDYLVPASIRLSKMTR